MREFTICTTCSGPTARLWSEGLRPPNDPCGPVNPAPRPSKLAASVAGARVPCDVCSTGAAPVTVAAQSAASMRIGLMPPNLSSSGDRRDGSRDREQARLLPAFADQLHADRQTLVIAAAGDDDRGVTRVVEDEAVRVRHRVVVLPSVDRQR